MLWLPGAWPGRLSPSGQAAASPGAGCLLRRLPPRAGRDAPRAGGGQASCALPPSARRPGGEGGASAAPVLSEAGSSLSGEGLCLSF